jgi:hypothetical protein
MTNLILVGFYFLLFTPIGILLRLTGRDPLRLKRPAEASLWIPHKAPPNAGRYYRQY